MSRQWTMRTVMVLGLAMALAGCPGGTNSGDGGSAGGAGGGTAGGTGGGTGGGATGNPLQSIAVTPASASVDPGATQALTATGTYADGSTRDATAEASWASSQPDLATVSTAGVVTGVLPGVSQITATVGAVMGTASLTVTGASLVSISLAPAAPQLGVGDAQPFTATGTWSDSTTQNITAKVSWASSAPSVASVSGSGVATALAIGSTDLSASLYGVTGTTALTVTAKTLRSIAVTPAYVSLAVNGTQQLTAMGTYSDGSTHDVTSTVTWASDTTSAATVSSAGLVTAVAPLSALSVRATSGVLSARCVVSVTNPGFTLVGISLAPQTMWVGQTFPLPMVAADFGGISSNYTYVSWASSNLGVATIDQARGTISALAAGTSTLTATTNAASGVLTGSNTLTVTEPPLSSVLVLPVLPKLAQGAVLQLTATGVYPDTNLNKDLTSTASWSSNNTSVVTVDSTGLARGVGAGTATVTAASGGKMGTTTVTVPSVAPPQTTVTLSPVNDNTIMYSSLVPARQTTVYPTTAMFNNPAVAVGCAWFYSPEIGFAPAHIDAACSQALIKFDLSSLAGKTVVSATLRLRTSVYGVGYVPRRWFIRALATQWNGATVTWNSASGFLHYVYSETSQDPPTYGGQVYELDQTNTVKNWVGGSYVNAGFELGLTNVLLPNITSSSLDQFEFFSSEDANGRGPQLVVTWQ